MKYYLSALKKYAVFKGRASRADYWYFFLFSILVSIVIAIAAAALELKIINTIYLFFIIIPSISIAVRRMHDVNKSGWFILIPIYGFILLFIAGTQGENNYGSDPKLPQVS